MTALISSIVSTGYPMKVVDKGGTLFADLYSTLGTKVTKLGYYRTHRFMGLTSVILRIVEYVMSFCGDISVAAS